VDLGVDFFLMAALGDCDVFATFLAVVTLRPPRLLEQSMVPRI